MVAAIKAVQEGCTVSESARDHDVPKTTLYDRVSGRVTHGNKPGPRPYLTSEEEQELGTYLKHCSKVGYGKTRRDVLAIVQNVAADKGVLRQSQVSSGWWRRFLERQKDLSLRQGDSTAHVRMAAMNRETMQDYFTLLKDTLETHDLVSRPAQIYNVDESGVPFNPRPSAGRKRAGDNERKRKPAKHPRTDHSSSSAFDQSECCICFVTYEDDQSGKDWVECACGRWLHEDCADDCFVDDEGKERLCLICLNQFCK